MIGYYIHHHGRGHLTRAMTLTAVLRQPVVALSTLPPPDRHPFRSWVQLPPDVDDRTTPYVDPTAGGSWHWAPLGASQAARMAAIARWVEHEHPSAVVVDVSVEVSLFVRLMGVPVVVMAMPGHRDDAAHQAAYRIADTIIAPWSADVYDPQWLRPYAEKTVYTGVVSRFEGQRRVPTTLRGDPTVLVMVGAGGSSLTAERVAAWRAATPGYTWQVAGLDGHSWVEDLWPSLCAARIAVAPASQGTVADLAAARLPAVVVPQDRPYGEQQATAGSLAAAGVATVLSEWPSADAWPDLLAATDRRDPSVYDRLRVDGAAARAAAAIAAHAA